MLFCSVASLTRLRQGSEDIRGAPIIGCCGPTNNDQGERVNIENDQARSTGLAATKPRSASCRTAFTRRPARSSSAYWAAGFHGPVPQCLHPRRTPGLSPLRVRLGPPDGLEDRSASRLEHTDAFDQQPRPRQIGTASEHEPPRVVSPGPKPSGASSTVSSASRQGDHPLRPPFHGGTWHDAYRERKKLPLRHVGIGQQFFLDKSSFVNVDYRLCTITKPSRTRSSQPNMASRWHAENRTTLSPSASASCSADRNNSKGERMKTRVLLILGSIIWFAAIWVVQARADFLLDLADLHVQRELVARKRCPRNFGRVPSFSERPKGPGQGSARPRGSDRSSQSGQDHE